MKKYSAFISLLLTINPTKVLAQTAESITGQLIAPPGVEQYIQKSSDDIALIFFLSNMIRVFTIVAGLYVVFNVILAAFFFLNSSGDASAYEKARIQITQSIIGLLIIVMSYTLTGIVGLIFFGDASIFLDPKI
ncbi:hypothetical protein KA078_04090 [Candidatus Woesebacteria bacterium]|jgi:small neutral amino acid transporter SnatA (MarC family)|nr:hypothetical protein [Candidatus Woesebacteria bacterium]